MTPCKPGFVRRTARASAGFSLLELLITVAIAGILLVLGLPTFTVWLQNGQVRTAAESIANGLQLARAEAVRRNTKVRFELTSTTAAGLSDWTVAANVDTSNADFEVPIQSRSSAEGSPNARVGVSTAAQPDPAYTSAITSGTGLPASVVFNAFGRADAGGMTRADVTNPNLSADDLRRLVILIGAGGQIRMCDPKLALASNPQGCA